MAWAKLPLLEQTAWFTRIMSLILQKSVSRTATLWISGLSSKAYSDIVTFLLQLNYAMFPKMNHQHRLSPTPREIYQSPS